MDMELHPDWNADVRLVAQGSTAQTMSHAPTAKKSRAGKLLMVALAAAITLSWMAFLCNLIVHFAESLF